MREGFLYLNIFLSLPFLCLLYVKVSLRVGVSSSAA